MDSEKMDTTNTERSSTAAGTSNKERPSTAAGTSKPKGKENKSPRAQRRSPGYDVQRFKKIF